MSADQTGPVEPTSTHPAQPAFPSNVLIGDGTAIVGTDSFKRFYSRRDIGVSIGRKCVMDGVHFAVGKQGQLTIGDHCYFSNAILLCDLEIRIGNHVMIGWNTTIADTDFHPLDPEARIRDAIACSPLGDGTARPVIQGLPVIIGNDVYIGPAVTILKGVTIGDRAWIEPGSLITRDVPAGARVLGNPAQLVPFEDAR